MKLQFSNNRDSYRRAFVEAWHKQQNNQPMQPLEQLIADVVKLHPEYHSLLENTQTAIEKDFDEANGQQNPFFHMGMHITLMEQVISDRPAGIQQAYRQLLTRLQDQHPVEHAMMDCLGESLWQAQRRPDGMPDEQAYLKCVLKLLANDPPRH
ncbi:MAG: DUF1841 family protein [gamma proteobacterium symbiont of Bathyaustriella thionipta]|nr:DUF1841 family protein [gamma proteobacterium symbiont of Bathyaustriella thionipta]